MLLKYSPILFLVGFVVGFSSSARIICYYTSWAIYTEGPAYVEPEDLDPGLCTHINYAFVALNDDGTLKNADPNADITKDLYNRVVGLKQRNPNLKVLLSIGGGSAPIAIFQSVSADPGKRARMVESARSFMEHYNFDGIDMDWEIPQPEDKDNFIALLREIKTDFDKNGWELTAAVRCIPYEGYDVPQMNQILTYINLMTYDMYGYRFSKYTGQNSPLYSSPVESDWEKRYLNIDSSVRNWIDAGASPEKLIVGLAFYGITFKLSDPNNNGLHAAIDGAGDAGPFIGQVGSLGYVEYCSSRNDWNCRWDDDQKVPICVKGDQWLGIDNEDSIKLKIDYIKQQSLGGAMIWSINQDDVHGSCGDANVLTRLVHDNL